MVLYSIIGPASWFECVVVVVGDVEIFIIIIIIIIIIIYICYHVHAGYLQFRI
jgi:hypothetical protein